jgi:hypothetical protein
MKNLKQFLVKAKKSTYAAGNSAGRIKEADGSTTLIFEEGAYKYHDNYFGGEPFGGREVVFFENNPVYMMVYYGNVDESINYFGGVYRVLMNALKLIPIEAPFRGPEKYEEGDWLYENKFVGDVDSFSGEENIFYKGKKVYQAKYIGGLVDRR